LKLSYLIILNHFYFIISNLSNKIIVANKIPIARREKSRIYTPIKVKNTHKIAKRATKNFKPIDTLTTPPFMMS